MLNYLLVGCVYLESRNKDPYGDVKNEVTLRFEMTHDELKKKPATFLFIEVLSLTFCGVQRAPGLCFCMFI